MAVARTVLLSLLVCTFAFSIHADKDDKDKDKVPPEAPVYIPPPSPEYSSPPPVYPTPRYPSPVVYTPPAYCPPPPSPPPECPPPPYPPPPSPPPPPPPSPPPPPKCNPGCIPAPPCGSCAEHTCPGKPPSPPYSSPPPAPRDGKSPPPKDEDGKKEGKKKKKKKTSCPQPGDPTDDDVDNLNDLLNLEFLLNNIYIKANLGLKGSRTRTTLDVVDKNDTQEGTVVSTMLEEFSTISIKQTSDMINLLGSRAARSPNDLNITNENLSYAVNQAFNETLEPRFNVQDNPIAMLLSIQTFPSLVASAATNILSRLQANSSLAIVSSVLPVLSSQGTAMRTYLFMEKDTVLYPYNYTVSEFSRRTNFMLRGFAGSNETGLGSFETSILGLQGRLSLPTVFSIIQNLLGGVFVIPGRRT